jgi:hypothetical protein
VQSLVDEILQRIIHKAMALDPTQAIELAAANAHPEMGSEPQVIGAHMASMIGTFVDHLQAERIQHRTQALMK